MGLFLLGVGIVWTILGALIFFSFMGEVGGGNYVVGSIGLGLFPGLVLIALGAIYRKVGQSKKG